MIDGRTQKIKNDDDDNSKDISFSMQLNDENVASSSSKLIRIDGDKYNAETLGGIQMIFANDKIKFKVAEVSDSDQSFRVSITKIN